jgi:hypothetical protein
MISQHDQKLNFQILSRHHPHFPRSTANQESTSLSPINKTIQKSLAASCYYFLSRLEIVNRRQRRTHIRKSSHAREDFECIFTSQEKRMQI